ncbi:MAG: sigma-70 family RNA polymerase sigma factor [bacterium]|nr:sigma-70 family RNA polymerase sigma factor [bacterium]
MTFDDPLDQDSLPESSPEEEAAIPSGSDTDSEEAVRELILRSQNGDQAAYQELVEMYRTRVASIAYGLVGNYEDARDIAQEVFIKVHRSLNRFDIKKKFFTWLYRLAVNASIDFLRANKKRSFHESINSDDNYSQYPDMREDSNLDIHIEKLERREIFQKIVDNLNPKQRTAFILCDLQGLSSNEAAEIIECPQVTLRWYLHEARKKIRRVIQSDYPEYFVQGKKSRREK